MCIRDRYEAAYNRFEFLCVSELNDPISQSAMAMYLNAGAVNYLNPEFIFIARDYGIGLRAEARFKASTYTSKTKVHFNIVQSQGGPLPDIQNLSNANLRLSFAGWDLLLKEQVGISLKDIGFTSYK